MLNSVKQRSILWVSIAFPPKQDPECIQTAKYFKYASAAPNFVHDVVTSAIPTLYMPVDPSLLPYDQGYRQKVEIPLSERRWMNSASRLLSRILPERVDTKDSFAKREKQVLSELENPPDLIYSRCFPRSSATMARALKRKYKVPWILHLSDPWADHNDMPGLRTEREYLEEASTITVTSDQTLTLYQSRYPEIADRFQVFPNVYDPERVETLESSPREPLRILHSGGLAGARDVEPLLVGFERFRNEHPALARQVELILVGDADRTNRRKLRKRKDHSVHWLGRQSYSRTLEEQAAAAILICIDTPSNFPVYFPSKLLDYVQARKPILALTSPGSQVSETFDKYGWHWVDYHNSAGFAEKLKSLLTENGESVRFLPPEFCARENAQRLVRLFEHTLDSGS